MKVFVAYAHADSQELARELYRALSGSGYEVFDPTTTTEHGIDIFASITAAIQASDVVIALLTSPNPNVYFELGMAASSNIPTLIASYSRENAVFDLAAAPYVELIGDTALDAANIARRVHEMAQGRKKQFPSRDLTCTKFAYDSASQEEASPVEFERWVAQVLIDAGYKVEPPPRSDSGFDLVIDGDPLTVVEIKHYRRPNRVPVGIVRQLLGAMIAAGAGRAILVSSAEFTQSARAAAAAWPIDLMTTDDLVKLPSRGTGSSDSS